MILYPLATVTRVAQARLLHPNLLLQNLQFPAKSSLVSGVTQGVGLQRGFTYAHKQSWQHQGEFTSYYVPAGTCLLLNPPIRVLPPACFQQSISLHLDTIAIAMEYCHPAANVLDRRKLPSLQSQFSCAHLPPNRSEKKTSYSLLSLFITLILKQYYPIFQCPTEFLIKQAPFFNFIGVKGELVANKSTFLDKIQKSLQCKVLLPLNHLVNFGGNGFYMIFWMVYLDVFPLKSQHKNHTPMK